MNENCQCPEPGYCPRHGMDKPRGVWRLCRGVECPRSVCAKMFAAWESGQFNGQTITPASPLVAKFNGKEITRQQPQAASRATAEQIPCQHRTERTGGVSCVLCGSRGEVLPVYGCGLHGQECTVAPSGRRGYLICISCDDSDMEA